MAEGVRMGGHEMELMKTSAIKNEKVFSGFDAFLFGCPAWHTVDLGPLNLAEAIMESDEGEKACQQYGKAITEKLQHIIVKSRVVLFSSLRRDRRLWHFL